MTTRYEADGGGTGGGCWRRTAWPRYRLSIVQEQLSNTMCWPCGARRTLSRLWLSSTMRHCVRNVSTGSWDAAGEQGEAPEGLKCQGARLLGQAKAPGSTACLSVLQFGSSGATCWLAGQKGTRLRNGWRLEGSCPTRRWPCAGTREHRARYASCIALAREALGACPWAAGVCGASARGFRGQRAPSYGSPLRGGKPPDMVQQQPRLQNIGAQFNGNGLSQFQAGKEHAFAAWRGARGHTNLDDVDDGCCLDFRGHSRQEALYDERLGFPDSRFVGFPVNLRGEVHCRDAQRCSKLHARDDVQQVHLIPWLVEVLNDPVKSALGVVGVIDREQQAALQRYNWLRRCHGFLLCIVCTGYHGLGYIPASCFTETPSRGQPKGNDRP